MVAKSPKSVKIKVLNEWLQGISRYRIAESNSIGAGTVTDIVQQARNNNIIPDIDLMRDLALKLKKEGLDVSHFASSVRLKKVLDRMGLPEEKLESTLEEINIYSFRRGMEEKDFVSKIDEILQMAYEFDIPIPDVLIKLGQKKI